MPMQFSRINSLFYLDDWLIIGTSELQAGNMVVFALEIVQEMGFLFNIQKSSLVPKQKLKWLKMQRDTTEMSLSLSVDN